MTDEEVYAGRFRDLAERSYNNYIFTFSDFLGAAQQDLLYRMERELGYAGMKVSGGRENADRVVVRFGRESELGYEQDFPIRCLRIEPLIRKFAEELSHRDYLGALMGLGVQRELLGDIVVTGETAYLFCLEHIAGYIMENLGQVRHTSVMVNPIEEIPEEVQPHYEERRITAASSRLDGVISGIYNLSRTQGQELFRSGKVFVNGKLCENRSYICKEGDIISVRGFGKFIFDMVSGTTGKGRQRIQVRVYM